MPRRWVFMDTEANESRSLDDRVQTWRLGVTAFDRNDTESKEWADTKWVTHHTPASLWETVDSYTRTKARTVVVAHNVAYDLRIGEGFVHLPALGWSLSQLALHERSMSATFRRSSATLVLCDSMSWLNLALAKIGPMVSIDKPDLPSFDGPEDEWENRCRADVAILRAAWLDLLSWIRDDDLGNWQRTGAAMAWANWRHRHYTHRVLVHSEQDAQDAESESTYTGRCEAWRHGSLPTGGWTEWDLPLAYARVAADVTVPVKLIGHRTKVPAKWVVAAPERRRVLAFARVTTSAPVLPYRGPHGVLWPTGTFEGWWWDAEIREALEAGADVSVGHAWIYRAAPALADWARWVISVAEAPAGSISEVRRAVAKHWSRALIGRFATRYTPWEPYGLAPEPGVGVHPIYDIPNDRLGEILTLGDEQFVGWEKEYGSDAVPSINAVVLSEARSRLWRLMLVAGLENVAYVDTDSLIVNRAGSELLEAFTAAGGGWGLRPKSDHRLLEVYGPRQLVTAGSPRVAGLPRQPERIGPNRWAGDQWEGLAAALAKGHTDRVVIRRAAFTLRGVDNRREHLAGGLTAPFDVSDSQEAASVA